MFKDATKRLDEIAVNLDQLMPDIIATQVMIEAMALHKKRIFDQGLDVNNQAMPGYSTDPGYYPKEDFVRKAAFKGTGKPNAQGVAKTGNKTMYIHTGYSGLRQLNGRRIDRKTLKFKGSLERALDVVKFGNAASYGNTDQSESDKFNGLDDTYNVFSFSTSEEDFLKTEIRDQAVLIAKR